MFWSSHKCSKWLLQDIDICWCCKRRLPPPTKRRKVGSSGLPNRKPALTFRLRWKSCVTSCLQNSLKIHTKRGATRMHLYSSSNFTFAWMFYAAIGSIVRVGKTNVSGEAALKALWWKTFLVMLDQKSGKKSSRSAASWLQFSWIACKTNFPRQVWHSILPK